MIRRAACQSAVRHLALGAAMLICMAPQSLLAAPGSPTHFTRDPALLRAKQQKLIDGMRAQNPQAAAALQQAFSQDIIAQIRPAFEEVGLDSDDMADMMAAYWINAWEAANGIVGQKTDRALVQGAQRQIASTIAKNPAMAKLTDAQRQDIADTMILQSLLIAARMEGAVKQGPEAQRQMSAAIAQEAQQQTKTDMRAVTLTADGFKPKNASAAGSPPPAPPRGGTAPATLSGSAAPDHPENWQLVDGVFFRSTFIVGVGGMMVQDFEPIILFKDGGYYEVEGPALEDMDLAAARRAKPARWGRWQKSGTGYALTDSKGRLSKPMDLQQGQFFKAFNAETGGNKLAKTYTRVSGGGNTAMGGDTIVAAQTDLTFTPDGSFMRKGSGGGSNNGQWTGASVASYARNANAGRYQIKNYTITMTQPDGSTKRQFFAFGSEQTPARLDTDIMFVGDNIYTVMHSRSGR